MHVRGKTMILKVRVKQLLIELSGACFWYWNLFYDFLEGCGVKNAQGRYPKEVYNKYNAMRAVLAELEKNEDKDSLHKIVSYFYRLTGPADYSIENKEKAIALLNEFKKEVGNDPIEEEINRRKKEHARSTYQDSINDRLQQKEKLQTIKNTFIELYTGVKHTPQERGYSLEKLFYDLLSHLGIEYTPPYKTHSEQIDGKLTHAGFDYLVEIKWTDSPITQREISIFDGKITGKAQSTRGLFLSINGFNSNAVNKCCCDAPRIILMDGEDLYYILDDKIDFFHAMTAKTDALIRKGNPHFALKDFLKS